MNGTESVPSSSSSGVSYDESTGIARFFKSKLAQKWVRYEWFYSPIDEMVAKESEFEICLKEMGIEQVCLHFKKKINCISIWLYFSQIKMVSTK